MDRSDTGRFKIDFTRLPCEIEVKPLADMCWSDTFGPKAPAVSDDQMCTVESWVSGGVVASTFTVNGCNRAV